MWNILAWKNKTLRQSVWFWIYFKNCAIRFVNLSAMIRFVLEISWLSADRLPQNTVHRKLLNGGSRVTIWSRLFCSLQWRHNGRDGVSNHQPHDCLLSRLFGRRSKKTSKLASLAFARGIHWGPVNLMTSSCNFTEANMSKHQSGGLRERYCIRIIREIDITCPKKWSNRKYVSASNPTRYSFRFYHTGAWESRK